MSREQIFDRGVRSCAAQALRWGFATFSIAAFLPEPAAAQLDSVLRNMLPYAAPPAYYPPPRYYQPPPAPYPYYRPGPAEPYPRYSSQPQYRVAGPSAETVVTLQRDLSDLGYDPGPADGAWGNRTSEAVRSFQRDHGLRVDGAASAATVAAIAGAAGQLHRDQPAMSIGDKTQDESGKYCIDKNTTMLLVRRSGEDLEFSMSSWSSRGHLFSVSGVGHPEAGGWESRSHMDSPTVGERCEVHLQARPDGGYAFWLGKSGPCSESQGFSYEPEAKIVFPARSRRGPIPANKTMAKAGSMERGGESCQ